MSPFDAVGYGLAVLGLGIALAGWFLGHGISRGLDALGDQIRRLKP